MSFYENKGDIKKVLLLFNILTVLQDKKSDMRFPFDKYKVEKWDIEHVCSQTDKEITDDNQIKQWVNDMFECFAESSLEKDVDEHIEELKEEIESIKKNASIQEQARRLNLQSELDVIETIKALSDKEEKINETEFNEAFLKVQEFFNENKITDKDNIANLALLDQETNRSYKNAYFPIKRNRIIANDKMGVFVPIATKNLFLKYYSHNSKNLMYWEESDASDYLESIKSLISPYIKGQIL